MSYSKKNTYIVKIKKKNLPTYLNVVECVHVALIGLKLNNNKNKKMVENNICRFLKMLKW